MLLLLLVFALIRALQGAPTSTPLDTSFPKLDIDPLFPRSLTFARRETHEIVLSCLATIFACTWTAIHPNIPGPTDSGWVIFRRRVTMTVYALLAPEFVVFWALLQRFSAENFVETYNETISKDRLEKTFFITKVWSDFVGWFRATELPPKLQEDHAIQWSMAHGFFVQMGGFMLRDKGRPIRVLGYDDLVDLIKEKKIDAPMTTEAEIKDRSKGDIISKTVVILQTTWFIVQCIARWLANLPVTELEQVTLAFALLNGITYGIWWNKPQNVGVPVYLEWRGEQGVEEDLNSDEATNKAGPEDITFSLKVPFLYRQLAEDHDQHAWYRFWTLDVVYRLIQTLLHPFGKMGDRKPIPKGTLRVPMYHAAKNSPSSDSIAAFVTSFIAILFGSVHFIPSWFPHFPSPSLTETKLWQASAIIITAEPMMIVIGGTLAGCNVISAEGPMESVLLVIIGFLWALGMPLYIFSRVILICLAFTSLRALPEAAHQTIDWVSAIPHL